MRWGDFPDAFRRLQLGRRARRRRLAACRLESQPAAQLQRGAARGLRREDGADLLTRLGVSAIYIRRLTTLCKTRIRKMGKISTS